MYIIHSNITMREVQLFPIQRYQYVKSKTMEKEILLKEQLKDDRTA